MKTTFGDVSTSVYKRSSTHVKGKLTMSLKMLAFLLLLDGEMNVGEVSQTMNIKTSEASEIVSKLTGYGLIDKVVDNFAAIDPRFVSIMTQQLSRFTGPIAAVVIEEATTHLNEKPDQLPVAMAAELVDIVGRQISDINQRSIFIRHMLRNLQELR